MEYAVILAKFENIIVIDWQVIAKLAGVFILLAGLVCAFWFFGRKGKSAD